MPSPKQKRLVADQPAQLAALTSPVRLELLEQFGIWGPCAVADVAAHMERPADALYYHVRKLVQVGLLEIVGRRRKAHRFEDLYKLPAEVIEVPRKTTTARVKQATQKAIEAVLRLAGRELSAALDDETAADEGPQRTFYGRRLKARLTKTQIRELNKHVNAIEAVFAAATVKPPRDGRTVAVTVVMTPVRGAQ